MLWSAAVRTLRNSQNWCQPPDVIRYLALRGVFASVSCGHQSLYEHTFGVKESGKCYICCYHWSSALLSPSSFLASSLTVE